MARVPVGSADFKSVGRRSDTSSVGSTPMQPPPPVWKALLSLGAVAPSVLSGLIPPLSQSLRACVIRTAFPSFPRRACPELAEGSKGKLNAPSPVRPEPVEG